MIVYFSLFSTDGQILRDWMRKFEFHTVDVVVDGTPANPPKAERKLHPLVFGTHHKEDSVMVYQESEVNCP